MLLRYEWTSLIYINAYICTLYIVLEIFGCFVEIKILKCQASTRHMAGYSKGIIQ